MQDLIDALPPLAFVAGVLLERLSRGRVYPAVPWWKIRGGVFFLAGATVAIASSSVLAPLVGDLRVVDMRSLGWLQIAPALLLLTFVQYWMHRAYHAFDPVFRWVHQIHHSAERIDVWTSFLAHPSDMLLQSLAITSVIVLLGLAPAPAGVLTAISFSLNIFQHLNIETPRWLGLIIQRPEAHNVHHQRGVHAFNYGDLPLWDMLFGTYQSPADARHFQVGYWDFASRELRAMLLGRDVTRPRTEL